MTIEGLQFWFDNKTPVMESIQLSAESYRTRFGRLPDLVLVSDKTLTDIDKSQLKDLPYSVRGYSALPALHYWAVTDKGVESLGGDK